MMGSAQRVQPQESLWRALAGFVHSQVTIFLVLSLALGVPLACQQRGMMSLLDLSPSALHVLSQGYSAGAASFPGMAQFQATHSAATLLTFVAAFHALPGMNQLLAPQTWALISLPDPLFSQPDLIPPEQPPR